LCTANFGHEYQALATNDGGTNRQGSGRLGVERHSGAEQYKEES
jgi:hypothetical protein